MSEAKILDTSTVKALLPDALIYRGTATTMDVMESGFYQIQPDVTADIPSSIYPYGVLVVMNTASFILQNYYPHNKYSSESTYKFATRMWTGGNWTGWRYYLQSS